MNLKFIQVILFWFFVAAYLVIAPMMTLHALGYVFDSGAGKWRKTGIISLASEPRNADIFINDELQLKKTPSAIVNLLPERYQVKVALSGYHAWEEMVEVKPEEVVRRERILIVPESLNVHTDLDLTVSRFASVADGRFFILFTPGEDVIEVSLYDVKKKKLQPALRYPRKTPGFTHRVEIASFPAEKRFILNFLCDERNDYYLIDTVEAKKSELLNAFLPPNPVNVRLASKYPQRIYCLTELKLMAYDFEKSSEKWMLADHVKSFEIFKDRIFAWTVDNDLIEINLDSRKVTSLLPDEALRRLLFGEKPHSFRQALMSNQDTMFWLNDQGKLVMNRLPYFIDDGVSAFALVPESGIINRSEKVIYWKENELWILDITATERKNAFFEQGPKKTLLWKSKRPIVTCSALFDGYHVLAATDEALWILEVGAEPGLTNKPPWLLLKHRQKRQFQFYFDEPSGKVYWIDEAEDRRRLMHEAKLSEPFIFSLPFRFSDPFQSPIQMELS